MKKNTTFFLQLIKPFNNGASIELKNKKKFIYLNLL